MHLSVCLSLVSCLYASEIIHGLKAYASKLIRRVSIESTHTSSQAYNPFGNPIPLSVYLAKYCLVTSLLFKGYTVNDMEPTSLFNYIYLLVLYRIEYVFKWIVPYSIFSNLKLKSKTKPLRSR